ncbi:receptor-like protein 9DC1 [Tripterygium wilfordii]|uniref:receptor-like protein 9DC1 n=1 Tax=Tripterygium wilfordii TaxID=458696 RepID=UPI0018F8307D|nr:receptor-like protein 9DC1 [Tripterygium wilfordii]
MSLQLCSHYDRLALIQFKNSFSLNSDVSYRCSTSYPKTKSWKEGGDCCDWDGVTCDPVIGRVIGLDLSCSWLYGSLDSNNSLFRLSRLQKLNLAHNNFQSSEISSEFGKLESLTHLNLSYSRFSGQVPSELSYLSKLISLHLYVVEVEVPTLRGLLQNCTVVQELFFYGVNMSLVNPGLLMNLSSSLTSLHLHSCDLLGKFPGDILLLPNLQLLQLTRLGVDFPMSNWSTTLRHLELVDLIDPTCGNDGAPPQSQSMPSEEDDSGSGFDWKIIMMGYSFGLVMGLSVGYIVFSGRPQWFVRMLEQYGPRKAKRSTQRRRGRRN